jgi:CheY-like chemotaxis protein
MSMPLPDTSHDFLKRQLAAATAPPGQSPNQKNSADTHRHRMPEFDIETDNVTQPKHTDKTSREERRHSESPARGLVGGSPGVEPRPTAVTRRPSAQLDLFAFEEAENGREALNRIKESKPDVILLDLMMPEMDGFAVVAALQKGAGWRDIPVIVITSLDLDAKDRARLNSGVQSVLVKERFQPAELVERIRRLVHSNPPVNNEMEAAS